MAAYSAWNCAWLVVDTGGVVVGRAVGAGVVEGVVGRVGVGAVTGGGGAEPRPV